MTTTAAAPESRDPLARLKSELSTLEQKTRERLKGTAVESAATRVKAELPRAVERQVDALLDRAGLVRKAKVAPVAANAVDAAAPVDAAAAAVDEVSAAPADEAGCVGQVA